MMPMGPMMGWGGGGGFGFVSMLIFWALLIGAVVAAIRWLAPTAGSGRRSGAGDRALEILRERYARGEVSKEEFEAKRRDLG